MRKCFHQIILYASLWGHIMIDDSCAKAQTTVGDVISVQVILGYKNKQAKQDISSKPVSSAPPWYLLHFLSPRPCLESLP